VPASAHPFANFAHLVRAWYPLLPSRRLPRGGVRSVELGRRRIALWRDERGAVHALDARCPHLGADLGQGTVAEGCLRCPFHHWQWGADGRCSGAPGHTEPPARRATAHRTHEVHGLIWALPAGGFVAEQRGEATEAPAASDMAAHAQPPTPTELELPGGESLRRYLLLRPPSQRIACHPHLVIGNGLDAAHFGPLHGMEYSAPPRLEEGPGGRLALHLRGAPRSAWRRRLAGCGTSEVVATFTVTSPSIAWATVESPQRFHVLFAAAPAADDTCRTSTVWFLPRRLGLAPLRCVLLMGMLLHDDRRILDRLHFRRSFSSTDAALRRFADLVDASEVAW